MSDQPGYTQTPNALLELLPLLPNAECRVLLAIMRKTYGWRKACDVISYSQLREATGMSQRQAAGPAAYTVPAGQPAANGNGGTKASERQIKMLFAIWSKNGYEGKLSEWIQEAYHCAIDDLTIKQASAAIETLQPKEEAAA